VVYIENRDMYFRINTVNQSFTYGNTFQTTLTLDYGRRPEFIIPDPWDILGSTSLDATANNAQTNQQATKEEEAEQKTKENQESKRTDALNQIKKEGSGTNTKSKEDKVSPDSTANSESAATKSGQPQPSTEAKDNQKKQEEKDRREKADKKAKELELKLQKTKEDLEKEEAKLENLIEEDGDDTSILLSQTRIKTLENRIKVLKIKLDNQLKIAHGEG